MLPVTANPLVEQLFHSALYGLAMLAIGTIALGLDVFASALSRMGASRETVRLLQIGAMVLTGIDVTVIAVLAACGACHLVLLAL